MANKKLIGTYPSGYDLLTKFTGAVVEAGALVEGTGLSAAAVAAITNEGTIASAAGAVGGSFDGIGGTGNAGVYLHAGGSVHNTATIQAGAGGEGEAGGYARGGYGGVAVEFSATGSATNSGVVIGGAGGAGIANYASGATGWKGGEGGAGIYFRYTASTGSVTNTGTILGGVGGQGGGGGHAGGTGGAGGSAILARTAITVVNSGRLAGGAGSATGYSYDGLGVIGAGGAGVSLYDGGLIANTGSILGGAGSAAFRSADGVVIFGGAVVNGSTARPKALIEGPIGVYASEATVTNYGTIEGAANETAAGAVGDAGVYVKGGGLVTNKALVAGGQAMAATGDAGGVGVAFANPGIVRNSGTIDGGLGAAGRVAQYGLGATITYLPATAGGAGGSGVQLDGGGGITNSGEMKGGAGGVGGTGGAYGRYPASYDGASGGSGGDGLYLHAAGDLTNSGTVLGGVGGVGGAAHSQNAPSSLGSTASAGGAGGGGSGLVITGGATVTNTGLIEAGVGGVGGAAQAYQGEGFGGAGGAGGTAVVFFSSATLLNSGTIKGGSGGAGGAGLGAAGSAGGAAGSHGVGVTLVAGGLVVNGSSAGPAGLIEGEIGVYIGQYGGTVVNYAVIEGTAYSVKLVSSADEVVAKTGSTFEGAMIGGGGALVAGASTGTINGLGAGGVLSGLASGTFSGFGTYVVSAGAAWTLTGTDSLAGGQSLVDDGSLDLVSSLYEAAAAGLTVAGGAVLTIAAGQTVTLQGAVVNAGAVAIDGATLTFGSAGLTLNSPGQWILSDSAANSVSGQASADTLTNASATISGAGDIGEGVMTLVNDAGAVIDADDALALTLDTGANKITNAGLIEVTGPGGMTIASAVVNTGTLLAEEGTLTCVAAVTGKGPVDIGTGGTMVFDAAFVAGVSFTGTSGQLVLAKSQAYTGTIAGFSTSGGTSLDLRDIGFVSAGEATFSGTASGGVLTVTDGTHTARIALTGDYLGSTFTASSDGHGGTIIVDPRAPGAPALVSAMAAFAPTAATITPIEHPRDGFARGESMVPSHA